MTIDQFSVDFSFEHVNKLNMCSRSSTMNGRNEEQRVVRFQRHYSSRLNEGMMSRISRSKRDNRRKNKKKRTFFSPRFRTKRNSTSVFFHSFRFRYFLRSIMELQATRQIDYLQRTLSIFLSNATDMTERFESLIDELIKENKQMNNKSPKVK